jgi:cobalt-zinc-cadmium efflux system outer membrane protein
MHRVLAALLVMPLCAPAALAQPAATASAGEPLTLLRALELAGATSPNIEAASSGVRAAEAQRRVAGLRPNPELNVDAENVIGTGPYKGLSGAETTVGVSLPLELGGKRFARVGVAQAQITRARLDVIVANADIRLRVTQAFIEAAASERRARNAREQVEIAQEALRAARVRVQAGRASPLEEQRAEVARINAGGAAERANRAVTVARSNLGRLIGQDPETLEPNWLDQRTGPGPRQAADANGTLALAVAQADVTTANAQLRLARAQRVPDLRVMAGARRLEETNDVAAVFGVSIPIPLFNNGRAGVDLARAQQTQAEALRLAAVLEAQQAIASAEADVANAEITARNATGPALAAASEAARIARIGYREGKFGQLDLLEAERTLAETRAAAIDALAAYHDAEARL